MLRALYIVIIGYAPLVSTHEIHSAVESDQEVDMSAVQTLHEIKTHLYMQLDQRTAWCSKPQKYS